jgi:hypothetical protein
MKHSPYDDLQDDEDVALAAERSAKRAWGEDGDLHHRAIHTIVLSEQPVYSPNRLCHSIHF